MVLTRSRARGNGDGHTQQTPKGCRKSARKEKNYSSKSTKQDSPFAEIRNSNEGRNKKGSSQVIGIPDKSKAEEKAAESSETVNSTPAGTIGKKNAVNDAIGDFRRVSDLDESAANSNEDAIHFVNDSKPDSAVSLDDDDDGDGSDIEAVNSEVDPVHNLLFTIDKVPSNSTFASPTSLLPDQHHDNDNSETSERLKTKSKSPANQELEGTSFDVQSKGKSAVSFEAPCEIDVGLEVGDCYVNLDAENPSSSKMNVNNILMKSQQDRLIKKSVLTPDFEKQHSIPPYHVSWRQLKKQRKKERESTKGSGWFDMKGEEMTDELRNDIKVLRMRSTLDPKRFYKSNDMAATPKFVQIGTVVDNPIDYYHSRVPKKQRKRTLVDELLSDTDSRRYNKRKYMELQEKFRHTSRGGRKHKFKKADRQET